MGKTDAAGNVLNDGANQYVCDAEGRLCAMQNMVGDMTEYIYDAEGRRAAKNTYLANPQSFNP